MKTRMRPALSAAMMVLILSAEATAQITSTVSGHVTDPKGAAVANATIILRNNLTGTERRAQANDEGLYLFHDAAPGSYTITVEVQGFKLYRIEIDVHGGAPTSRDVQLVAAAAGEVRDVIAGDPPPPPLASYKGTVVTEMKTVVREVTVPKDEGKAEFPEGYVRVKVFYATDRNPTGTREPAYFYGGERAIDERVSYGFCYVSIPRDHRMGALETPSILKFEVRKDPEKHVVLLSVTEKSYDGFFNALSKRVVRSKGREAFVFIHGYDVTFEDAARRTAQLSYDLAFDGAPILYSWPSRGCISCYSADEATAEWTTPHLKKFLEDVAAKSQATTVYLIAHSMGNRALARALHSIATEQRTSPLPRFQQIVLAAPDIDLGVFTQLAEAMKKASNHITLYFSSADKALDLSKWIHIYPRAGTFAIIPGVDTIDVSALDTGFLSHSYFGENKSVISDIFRIMKFGKPPNERCGIVPKLVGSEQYWAFEPALAKKCPPD